MDPETLLFKCAGIENGGKFPIENTGRGRDVSPAFLLGNLSPAARTLAVTLEDVRHPLFRNFTHWLIWNIPAAEKIAGAIPGGRIVPELGSARQGIGYGWFRYAGPKPPKGSQHMYRFTVYVLDGEIDLPFPPTKGRFLKRAKGHILQRGEISGVFE